MATDEHPPVNPRYVNYARAHGRTPDEQLAQDRKDYPGGCMVGFVLWNRARIVEASYAIPDAFYLGTLINHDAYDHWLTIWTDNAGAFKRRFHGMTRVA